MSYEPLYHCRHILTSGHRCQSPSLRHEDFCYHHHTTRKPIVAPGQRRRRSSTFALPALDDRTSVSMAITEIAQRIAANEIDPKRAGLLLYACQIASINLPRTDRDQDYPARTVDRIVQHPTHGPIAPQDEYREPTRQADPGDKVFRDPESGKNRYFEDILIQEAKQASATLAALEAARRELEVAHREHEVTRRKLAQLKVRPQATSHPAASAAARPRCSSAIARHSSSH